MSVCVVLVLGSQNNRLIKLYYQKWMNGFYAYMVVFFCIQHIVKILVENIANFEFSRSFIPTIYDRNKKKCFLTHFEQSVREYRQRKIRINFVYGLHKLWILNFNFFQPVTAILNLIWILFWTLLYPYRKYLPTKQCHNSNELVLTIFLKPEAEFYGRNKKHTAEIQP